MDVPKNQVFFHHKASWSISPPIAKITILAMRSPTASALSGKKRARSTPLRNEALGPVVLVQVVPVDCKVVRMHSEPRLCPKPNDCCLRCFGGAVHANELCLVASVEVVTMLKHKDGGEIHTQKLIDQ